MEGKRHAKKPSLYEEVSKVVHRDRTCDNPTRINLQKEFNYDMNYVTSSNESLNNRKDSTVHRTVHITPMARFKSLKGLTTPCLKIIYTNTDQFTITKKEELLRRIESEKPGIVAICEAKPKSGTDRALVKYDIPNFDLHPVNLDNTIGRGIAIYTYKSIAKSTIQISNDSNFEEAGLLEIRLRGGNLFLFAC